MIALWAFTFVALNGRRTCEVCSRPLVISWNSNQILLVPVDQPIKRLGRPQVNAVPRGYDSELVALVFRMCRNHQDLALEPETYCQCQCATQAKQNPDPLLMLEIADDIASQFGQRNCFWRSFGRRYFDSAFATFATFSQGERIQVRLHGRTLIRAIVTPRCRYRETFPAQLTRTRKLYWPSFPSGVTIQPNRWL